MREEKAALGSLDCGNITIMIKWCSVSIGSTPN
jgi:hypothetical protein